MNKTYKSFEKGKFLQKLIIHYCDKEKKNDAPVLGIPCVFNNDNNLCKHPNIMY